MITDRRAKSWVYPIMQWLNWITFGMLLLIPAFLDSEYNVIKPMLPNLLTTHLDFISAWSFFILIPVVCIQFISDRYLRSALPKNVDLAIKRLLDEFHRDAFPSEDSNIEHRVTLFHYKWLSLGNILQGKCPWGGWLIPYERSGQFSRRSRARFRTPKNRPNKAEGFASTVFTSGNCEYIHTLPNPFSSSGNAQKYAKQTGVPFSWVQQRVKREDPMPRCLWGVPIEVNGETWGVIIVDSKKTKLSGKTELKKSFGNTGTCLSCLLQKH